MSVAVNGTHIQGAAPSYQLAPICSVVPLADSHERAAFIQVRVANSVTKAHCLILNTTFFYNPNKVVFTTYATALWVWSCVIFLYCHEYQVYV